MQNDDANRSLWRFFDGAASISASMLLAVALNICPSCDRLFALGYLSKMTDRADGIIITATLLLFPTTAALYGGFKLFFAAKEAVERKARERGRREGIDAGRQAERERINRALERRGLSLTPEIAKILAGDEEPPSP